MSLVDKQRELDKVFVDGVVPDLYTILNDNARAWHYTIGNRREQRKSIRDSVCRLSRALANGGYATISALGGFYTLSIGDGEALEGYSPSIPISAYIVGLPVIDFGPATSYHLPIPVIGDKKHWRRDLARSMARSTDPNEWTYAPVSMYLDRGVSQGAALYFKPAARTKEGQYT